MIDWELKDKTIIACKMAMVKKEGTDHSALYILCLVNLVVAYFAMQLGWLISTKLHNKKIFGWKNKFNFQKKNKSNFQKKQI